MVYHYYLQAADFRIPLSAGTLTIGRSTDCDLSFPRDRMLSRQHARVVVSQEGVAVEDLGSMNGTYVQGRPVRGRRLLSIGERLRLGEHEFLVCEGVPTPIARDAPTRDDLPALRQSIPNSYRG